MEQDYDVMIISQNTKREFSLFENELYNFEKADYNVPLINGEPTPMQQLATSGE